MGKYIILLFLEIALIIFWLFYHQKEKQTPKYRGNSILKVIHLFKSNYTVELYKKEVNETQSMHDCLESIGARDIENMIESYINNNYDILVKRFKTQSRKYKLCFNNKKGYNAVINDKNKKKSCLKICKSISYIFITINNYEFCIYNRYRQNGLVCVIEKNAVYDIASPTDYIDKLM